MAHLSERSLYQTVEPLFYGWYTVLASMHRTDTLSELLHPHRKPDYLNSHCVAKVFLSQLGQSRNIYRKRRKMTLIGGEIQGEGYDIATTRQTISCWQLVGTQLDPTAVGSGITCLQNLSDYKQTNFLQHGHGKLDF